MRKLVSLLLCITLMSVFSLKLYTQSPEEELDQLELLKQFAGTWRAETGEDSVVILTYEPFNEGMIITQENIANGEAFSTVKAIIGVSNDKKTLISQGIGPDGVVGFQYGKFVTENKNVAEFYRDNIKHPLNIQEFEFQSPDVFTVRGKYRGESMTWPDDWGWEVTFRKID